MLNLLDVVGQLVEQERVDSLQLTYHSPYDVACNSERHFCHRKGWSGRVGVGRFALFGGKGRVPHVASAHDTSEQGFCTRSIL